MDGILEIGRVESKFDRHDDPFEMRKHHSTIVIHNDFVDGLYRLGESSHITVVFYFDQSKKYKLQTNTYSGEFKGVFASRSPNRPSSIGVTTVKLEKIENNRLYVEGLDALNNTPVLDIKPFVPTLDSGETAVIYDEQLKKNPRRQIMGFINRGNLKELLLMTGQIHGHFCAGVTIGVIASYLAMKKLNTATDGMEDIIAIVEVNSCFVDGIQLVAGCSFGNNGLIYRDIGKTAVTFANHKTGKGYRYCVNRSYIDEKSEEIPRYRELFTEVINNNNRDPQLMKEFKKAACKSAFAMLDYDFDKLFTIQEVTMNIPKYSKLYDSFICDCCKESTMKSRKQKIDNKQLCPVCSGKILQSDGNGIREIDSHYALFNENN
ncbi:MAG: tRNA (N6-threonylcarbamoyladenosine(37)-N6)-methyltransferase TrmO [Chitinispirillia bacterium]|jgi:formylmethanofuran dehydrogenase subunit E